MANQQRESVTGERSTWRDTGVSDELYNVVSVLYHALQAAETCSRYAMDAESEADMQLTRFFRDMVEENRRIAERAKQILAARIGAGIMEDEEEEEDEDDDLEDEEEEEEDEDGADEEEG